MNFQWRELSALLCLVLLAAALLSPMGAPDVAALLPIVETLCAIFLAVCFFRTFEADFRIVNPSLPFVSLRAPPQN